LKDLLIKCQLQISVLCLFLLFFLNAFSQDDGSNKFEIDDIKIEFKGEKTFEENALTNLLASRDGDEFSMPIYLLDVERIKKFYFDNGFFDAVVDTALVYSVADKEVIEKFIVTQNERYRYFEINYKGLDSINAKVMGRIFSAPNVLISKGGFYSRDTINLEKMRILNELSNNGYATAQADNPLVLKYETNDPHLKNKVNITLTFNPKLLYEFGSTKINFKGHKRYNITENDVRRELTYSENQIYDKGQVVTSELNLAKISILESPRISIDRVDTAERKIYLAVSADIGNKYDFTPEVFGYYFQNQSYIGPGISFSDKYFFGGGRILTTTARFYFHSFSDNRLELVNNIYQPFLFGNRNTQGNWNIGIEYRLNPDLNATRVINSFGIGYDLPAYTYINRITSSWDIENTRYILKEEIKTSDSTSEKLDYNYFTSTIDLGLIHNSLNNIQFPFKGYFQSYEFEESGLIGSWISKLFNTQTISYFKFTNFNSFYQNLNKREVNVTSVLAGKVSSGIIIEYGDNTFNLLGQEVSSDRVPTEEKFVCGGSSSIRGWGARQLGIVANKEAGGNFIIENSIEHRIRPFLGSNNVLVRDVGFASFIDFGNVWSEIGKFKLNEIAIAAGAGIRYYTIIGAVRFDVGFKIYDPQPGPVGGSNWLFASGCNFRDKYNFQFGIGNTF